MATHKSAERENRKSQARRLRNRARRTRVRSAIKRFRAAVSAGDVEAARTLLPTTFALLDRTGKSGALPRGATDRQKSRLTLALNRLAASR
jgi:small subunit ribosomal protein S20